MENNVKTKKKKLVILSSLDFIYESLTNDNIGMDSIL